MQCSVFQNGFDMVAIEGVIDIGKWEKAPPVYDIIEALVDDSLIVKDQIDGGAYRYSMLASIHDYAAKKYQQEIGEQDLFYRHATYYATLVRNRRFDGYERLEVELDNLMLAVRKGPSNAAAECCLGAVDILQMKGPLSLAVELTTVFLKRTDIDQTVMLLVRLARVSCLRINGKMGEARSESRLVFAQLTQMKTTKETLEAAFVYRVLNLATPTEQFDVLDLLLAKCLIAQGNIEDGEGIPEKALDCYTKALTIYKKQNFSVGLADLLRRIAGIHLGMGSYQQALQHLQKALQVVQNTDDSTVEAEILGRLGNVYERLEEYERSLEYNQKALQINQQIGHKSNEGNNLGSLGNIYKILGMYDKAISHYKQAVQIGKQIGNKVEEIRNVGNIGVVYLNLGIYDKAIQYHKRAIELSQKMGDTRREAIFVGNLGIVYSNNGEYQKAIRCFKRTTEISHNSKDLRNEGLSLGNTGELYYEMGNLKDAISHLQQAIAICDSTFSAAAGAFRATLALIMAKTEQFQQSFLLLQKGEAQVGSHPLEYGKFLCKKAKIYYWSGNMEVAHHSLRDASDIFNRLGGSSDGELSILIEEVKKMMKESK